MRIIFRSFSLTLIFGLFAIIGFAGTPADVPTSTNSATASVYTTDNAAPGRASPTMEQSYYSEWIRNNNDGITTTETAQATSFADLYFTNTANHSVTRNDGLNGAIRVKYDLIGSASYRYVNYTRQGSSPTPTGMPAALSVSGFTFSNAVFVTVKEVERPAGSFL